MLGRNSAELLQIATKRRIALQPKMHKKAEVCITHTSAEPRGMIRVTCPISLMFSSAAPIISRYLAAHPQVRVQFSATNRRVDVIEEGVDVALRVGFHPSRMRDWS
jgi:DNA-binding transcriptional LysR family regulator